MGSNEARSCSVIWRRLTAMGWITPLSSRTLPPPLEELIRLELRRRDVTWTLGSSHMLGGVGHHTVEEQTLDVSLGTRSHSRRIRARRNECFCSNRLDTDSTSHPSPKARRNSLSVTP